MLLSLLARVGVVSAMAMSVPRLAASGEAANLLNAGFAACGMFWVAGC